MPCTLDSRERTRSATRRANNRLDSRLIQHDPSVASYFCAEILALSQTRRVKFGKPRVVWWDANAAQNMSRISQILLTNNSFEGVCDAKKLKTMISIVGRCVEEWWKGALQLLIILDSYIAFRMKQAQTLNCHSCKAHNSNKRFPLLTVISGH